MSELPLLLYVSDAEAIGGAEGYLQTLLLHADRARYRVGLALPEHPATRPLVDRVRAAGAEVVFYTGQHRDGLSPAALWRGLGLLRELRPRVAHFVLTGPRRCAELVLAAALLRVPRRVATFQLVTPVPRFGWLAGALRMLNRRAQFRALHHGVAVSSGNARLLVEQYGFPAARLALIPNAVDTARFAPRPPDPATRAAWGVPAGAPLIGVVGRLGSQKGHRVLLEALPRVWEQHPGAHVALIGAGELEGQLRALASQVGDHGRVHFVGRQDDVPAALAALDLFALPSLYEGLPFAVLEAMAAGRAIVATAVDGTAEVISQERSGVLVPPGAPGPLADAIARLLSDPALRERLGRAARAEVVARFDQRQMLERTYALYE